METKTDSLEINDLIASIDNSIKCIRKHINTHRYKTTLLENITNWHQICCALDVIEDTMCAVHDYKENDFPDASGLKYIYVYGLMQALILQQDATRELRKAFNIEPSIENYKKIEQIRFYRNASIGHPVGQLNKYYNHISRMSLSKDGFTLTQWEKDSSNSEFYKIDITLILNEQLAEIEKQLININNTLENIDKVHLEKFEDNLLEDIFHSSMGYIFSKIAEAINYPNDPSYNGFGLNCVNMIEETYKKFELALKERNELDSYTRYDLEEYYHSIKKIKDFINCNDTNMSEADAYIYLFYMRERHSHFVSIAKEIDEQYKNNLKKHK